MTKPFKETVEQRLMRDPEFKKELELEMLEYLYPMREGDKAGDIITVGMYKYIITNVDTGNKIVLLREIKEEV